MLLKPNPENHCFGCGGANDRGMQLTFEQDDAAQRIRGRFHIPGAYRGGRRMAHGGIIALLLDETMAKVSRFRQDHAVTGELSVKYLKPVPVEEEIVIEAWEVERDGRNLFRQGEIRDASGVILAQGRGHFVAVDPERFRPPQSKAEFEKH
jgi:acyl-coenzyme A thioesterase PaaI-like protein